MIRIIAGFDVDGNRFFQLPVGRAGDRLQKRMPDEYIPRIQSGVDGSRCYRQTIDKYQFVVQLMEMMVRS
jgi:hypothetical protein